MKRQGLVVYMPACPPANAVKSVEDPMELSGSCRLEGRHRLPSWIINFLCCGDQGCDPKGPHGQLQEVNLREPSTPSRALGLKDWGLGDKRVDHTTKCSLESKSLQLAAAVPAAVVLLRITGCSGSETHNSGIGRSGATAEDDSNLLKSGY